MFLSRQGSDARARRVPRITRRSVDAMKADRTNSAYWDGQLTGLGVRARRAGRKSSVVQTAVSPELLHHLWGTTPVEEQSCEEFVPIPPNWGARSMARLSYIDIPQVRICMVQEAASSNATSVLALPPRVARPPRGYRVAEAATALPLSGAPTPEPAISVRVGAGRQGPARKTRLMACI